MRGLQWLWGDESLLLGVRISSFVHKRHLGIRASFFAKYTPS